MFLISTVLIAIGAIGMMVRARMQKKPVMAWLFLAILIADVIGTTLIMIGKYMK